MSVQRISPEETRSRLEDGQALLVCAYGDEEKCERFSLPEAISYPELRKREDTLDRAQQLIFY